MNGVTLDEAMIILLTGATGFMGSHVARDLISRGHEVHAVIRKASDRARIMDLEGRLRIWEGEMDHVPITPDLAVHLAWITTPGKYSEADENRDCLRASLRLLDRLRCRVVFAGTCFEFDTSLNEGPLREDSPTRPFTLYSTCKDTLRQAVVARPDSAWVRFFYLYGPGEHPGRRIPMVIRSVLRGEHVRLTSGVERRDYLHVEDAARAVSDVAFSHLEGTVNIGSGEAPSTAEVMTKIGKLAGRPDLIRLGVIPDPTSEPPLIVADNSRLRFAGWTRKYDLDEGLRGTVDWWRDR
jgi:nucleoside-diphosphate-sugar epimerase